LPLPYVPLFLPPTTQRKRREVGARVVPHLEGIHDRRRRPCDKWAGHDLHDVRDEDADIENEGSTHPPGRKNVPNLGSFLRICTAQEHVLEQEGVVLPLDTVFAHKKDVVEKQVTEIVRVVAFPVAYALPQGERGVCDFAETLGFIYPIRYALGRGEPALKLLVVRVGVRSTFSKQRLRRHQQEAVGERVSDAHLE
jgi:hypothetical protein